MITTDKYFKMYLQYCLNWMTLLVQAGAEPKQAWQHVLACVKKLDIEMNCLTLPLRVHGHSNAGRNCATQSRMCAVFWALRSLHGNAGVAVYLNLQSVRLNCARHTVLQKKP